MRLWGTCPGKVEIEGTAAGTAAVTFLNVAGGSEVHRVALTGGAHGFAASGSTKLLAEEVWVHGTDYPGIYVADDAGETSATVRGCLVEDARGGGMLFRDVAVEVESSLVRGIAPFPGLTSVGILTYDYAASGAGAPAPVTVRRSVVEDIAGSAVATTGPGPTIESSVLQRMVVETDGTNGAGIVVTAQEEGGSSEAGTVLVRTSVVRDNGGWGLALDGAASAVVERTALLRNGWDRALAGEAGGVGLQAHPGERPSLTMTASSIDGNASAGINVLGGDATVTTSVVRGTTLEGPATAAVGLAVRSNLDAGEAASASAVGVVIEGNVGGGVLAVNAVVSLASVLVRGPADLSLNDYGIFVGSTEGFAGPARLACHRCLIERFLDGGVTVIDAHLELDASVVRDIASEQDGLRGGGIEIVDTLAGALPADAIVTASVIERTSAYGVGVFGGDLHLAGSVVRETGPQALDGSFGDGVTLAFVDEAPVSATVIGCRLEKNERAGLANFGGAVHIGGTVVECNGFELERSDSLPSSFEKQGDNLCGCPATLDCQVVDSGLDPVTHVDVP